MNSAATEYLLLEKSGTVPRSTILSPDGVPGPTVQALNMGFLPYPMPPAIHAEHVRSEMRLIDLAPSQLDSIEVFPEIMGRAVAVDAKHWYKKYGLARGPPGEWGYDWKKWAEGVPVITQGQGKFSMDLDVARKMATDLQLLYLSIKEIQKHPTFVEGTLLPAFLKTSTLFRHDFTAARQIRTLAGLAQISLCTGIAFINGWRLVMGPGWDSTLLPGRLEFLRRFRLNLLPLRGGIFNLEQTFDGYVLNRYLKHFGPVFIVNPAQNHPQKHRLL
ncbi:hypothetical protein ARMSODRAFT_1024003 [Armillaria solidipes]|uniref:Uncharacterized protein n=1 Tax=Armillaria solidipes TaxID=1076256 RepID=A0A2H3BBX4_9AGAR|nr:hypothetical protein ARMSODRAFT_1024003 [Armillaria solidipes]